MKKVGNFLLRLIIILTIVSLIIFCLYFFNQIFHFWKIPAFKIQSELKEVNKIFFIQIAAGVSVGAILLLIIVFIFPFFTKNVDTKNYIKNLILGLVASFVFFLSQTIYKYFEKFGSFYKILSIIAVTIITLIIVEIMALFFHNRKKEIEFRTTILAGIASGLIFGIILNISLLVIDLLKISIK
jgi:hypothetical protein